MFSCVSLCVLTHWREWLGISLVIRMESSKLLQEFTFITALFHHLYGPPMERTTVNWLLAILKGSSVNWVWLCLVVVHLTLNIGHHPIVWLGRHGLRTSALVLNLMLSSNNYPVYRVMPDHRLLIYIVVTLNPAVFKGNAHVLIKYTALVSLLQLYHLFQCLGSILHTVY